MNSRGPPPPIPPRPGQSFSAQSASPFLRRDGQFALQDHQQQTSPTPVPPPFPPRSSYGDSSDSSPMYMAAPEPLLIEKVEWTKSALNDPTSPYPTSLMRRLADSIFFHLTSTIAPLHTPYLDPYKLFSFYVSVTLIDTENIGNLACHTLEAVFQAVGIQYERVHGIGKNAALPVTADMWLKIKAMSDFVEGIVPALTQAGWLHFLDLYVRRDPSLNHILLSRAVDRLSLIDPLTRTPFPPLPRSALPEEPDPVATQEWDRAQRAGIRAIQGYSQGVQALAGITVQGAQNIGEAARDPYWERRYY